MQIRFKLVPTLSFLAIQLLCAHSAIAQYNHLLHKSYGERAPLLVPFYHREVLDRDSVTLFGEIKKIEQLARKNSDEELLLETKLMRAHYFYSRNRFPQKIVLGMLEDLKTDGLRKNKLWLEAMAENMLALYHFYELKNYELAFEHHLRVYELIKDISPGEFPYKQDCLDQLAYEYYVFEDYQRAIFFGKEALKADPPKKMNLRSSPLRLGILNTIGSCYHRRNMIDSADYYFNQVVKGSVIAKSAIWEGIGSGNLGRNELLRGRYNQARYLVEKELLAAEDDKDIGVAASALTVLGDISLRTGNIALARQQLTKAHRYIRISGEPKRLKDLYPLLSKLSTQSGDIAKASMYLDSAIFIRDSLKDNLNAMKLLKATQRVDLERYRSDLGDIESQRKINVLERNAAIIFILIMAGAAVVVYRAQQQKNRVRKLQEQLAREELAAAAKQLDTFAKNLAEKNTLIALLQNTRDGAEKEAVTALQKSTILTEDDWTTFRELFEKVHQGFFERLKIRFPDLSPAEVRFMALSRLDLPAREMAAMLGVGTDTIRQHRSRIRRKLNLREDLTVETLSHEI